MEQVVIALLMLVNNEIVEHRIQPSLSECLKRKRIAQRSETGTSINHQCIKSKAEIE